MTTPVPKSPRVALSLDTITSRHASLRTWRARYALKAGFTELFLATGNITNPGDSVTGSFWAVRTSNPIPLISALLGMYPRDPSGLMLQVPPSDTLPFTGEFMGRFLSWREDAGVGTVPFSPMPPGDWWVTTCLVESGGKSILGINEIESVAAIVPENRWSARVLSASLLGLWITTDGSGDPSGAA